MTITFNLTISEADALVDTAGAINNQPFTLTGGRYALTASAANWGGGSITLNKIAGDGATTVVVAIASSNGYQNIPAPAGLYTITSTVGASLPYLDVTRIPG